ncbi:hypothetical protein glysoja_018598 [Glycine soja]|nr:hypothetical protein glysoja_018598 [Glycine soja]
MSFTFNLHVPKALPPLPSSSRGTTSLFFSSKQKSYHNNTSPCQSLLITCRSHKPNYDDTSLKYTSLALQVGALLALVRFLVLLWAPFLNFRKFPRDTSLQYPWSVPEDPSKIRSSYAKYPYAEPEDYDNL